MQFTQFWWILFVIFIYPDHGIDSHFEKEASAFTSPCEVSLVADQTRTETKWCHNTSVGEMFAYAQSPLSWSYPESSSSEGDVRLIAIGHPLEVVMVHPSLLTFFHCGVA